MSDRPPPTSRSPRPTPLRIAAVSTGIVVVHALLVWMARETRSLPSSGWVVLATGIAAVVSALLVGAAGEWMVHRFIMHRAWRPLLLRVIYDLHHVGHHFIHFTPARYVHDGPINYIPVWPPQPGALCRSAASRWLSMAAQFVFYVTVACAVALLPTALAAHNTLFTVTFSATMALEIFLFVRLHDAIHYPGQSRLERLPLFGWLDRHHYIHHIDTRANTNFLLPLGDLLFGTLRTSVTPWEEARFPSYRNARAGLVVDDEPGPVFRAPPHPNRA
jgi:hypothetical protein